MKLGWFTKFGSCTLSLILHVALGTLLIVSFDFTSKPEIKPRKDVNFVEAVVVDKKQIDLELARIKKVEDEKHQKEKKRLNDLEKKATKLKNIRLAEEKKLAETKKKKEQEQKRRKVEQDRLATLEKEKTELGKQRELEEKRLAETKKKKEQEQDKLATLEKEKTELRKQRELEEKKIKEAEEKAKKLKAAEEKRRQEAEAAKKKKLEEELAAELAAEEAAELARKDRALINNIASNIKRSIESKFNKVGLPQGIACVLRVRLNPGGEVVNVSIAESSGNEIFDRRAVNATEKASPLPVPDDVATFDRLNLRENNILFEPTN